MTDTPQPINVNEVDPDEIETPQEHYGTLPEQALAGLEGVGQGVAGPLAPAAEIASGLTSPEDIRGRAEANPWTHGGGELAGFAGSAFIPGLDEASLAGQIGKIGEGVTEALPEATSVLGNMATNGVRTGAEMAAFQASDELSRMVTQDPNQSLQNAALNVGLAGILGGAGGAVLGSVSPLWNKFTNKIGTEKLATDYMGELKFLNENPDLVEGATNEVNDRIAATDKMIKGGLKGNLINTLVQDVAPDQIDAHIQHIEELIENAPRALKRDPSFQDAVDRWRERVSPTVTTPPSNGAPEPVTTEHIQPALANLRQPTLGRTPKGRFKGIVTPETIEGIEPQITTIHGEQPSLFPEQAPTTEMRNPAEIFAATEDLKRQMQEWGKYDFQNIKTADKPFRDASQNLASALRESLEDQKTWGEAGRAQAIYNKAISPLFSAQKEFLKDVSGKELGENVADPRKLDTLLKQGERRKAGLKENHVKNYLDLTQKAADKINELYHSYGLEQPLEEKLNPATVVNHMLDTEPTHGVQLARWVKRGGAAGMTANAAGHITGELTGGTLGFLVGHPLVGAWMGDKILKPVFTALAKPLAEKAIDATAARAATDYVGNVIKGQRVFSHAVSNFFKASADIIPRELIPNQASRDRLEKSLDYASNDQNLMNIGGNLGHYLPDHASIAAETASKARDYLASIKPKTVQANQLDPALKPSRYEHVQYERQLDNATQPLMLLKYAKRGTLQAQDLVTVKTIFPGLVERMGQSLYGSMVQEISEGRKIPYHERSTLSLLMGQPLSSLETQPVMASIMASNGGNSQQQTLTQPKKVSKSTASTMEKMNRLYATNSQRREAGNTKS